MTAPTNADGAGAPAGTQVARVADRDANLTREGKLHMARIRETRALTVALTNEQWGQALSPQTRHAVAEYMRRNRLDVGEVEVLGNKIYRTANYYKRRVAEMRTRGVVEWTDGEHIGPDAQLDAAIRSDDPEIVAWARTESFRRLKERIRWAVPEDATHAYVVRIKLTTEKNPVEGADWITPARKNSYGKIADPIGASEPEKTVITRAWRRAGLLAAAEIPELRSEEEVLDAQAVVVEQRVEQLQTEEHDRERGLQQARPPRAIAAAEEPYGAELTTSEQPREAVTVDASQHRPDPDALQRALAIEDPYEESAPALNESTDAPAPKRSAAASFLMPFGGEEFKGKPLGDVPSDELVSAAKWARKNGKFPDFVTAADELLEERRFAEDSAR